MRMHPVGLSNGYFDAEAAAMNVARDHVPTPEIVGVSHKFAEGGFDLLLMEEMPGENMRHYLASHPENEVKLVVDMGRKMAELHKVRVDGYGFFDNDYAKATGRLRGLHDSLRGHILAALPANLKVLVDARYISEDQAAKITHLLEASQATECADPRLLHNDMADWNVLTDGEKITAILDWDECFGGDPIADIACWSLFFPPMRLDHFIQGYNEVEKLPPNLDEKLHLYRLRYIVSKLSLRHRKLGLQNDGIIEELIRVGLEALATESAYFGL